MAFAIPMVFVSDADTEGEAYAEANTFVAYNAGEIAFSGDAVKFEATDPEDLDAKDPEFACVVEVR